MKMFITMLLMMSMQHALSQNGKAFTTKKTFSRETTVSIEINAEAAVVWALLTNAADYPRWNSTIISIEGTITERAKIKLTSTLDPKRSFRLKVKTFQPEQTLVWGDAMGERTFTIDVKTNKPGTQPDGRHEFPSGKDAIQHMKIASGMQINLYHFG